MITMLSNRASTLLRDGGKARSWGRLRLLITAEELVSAPDSSKWVCFERAWSGSSSLPIVVNLLGGELVGAGSNTFSVSVELAARGCPIETFSLSGFQDGEVLVHSELGLLSLPRLFVFADAQVALLDALEHLFLS